MKTDLQETNSGQKCIEENGAKDDMNERTSLLHLKYRTQYLEQGRLMNEQQENKMILKDNSLKLNHGSWKYYDLEQVFTGLEAIDVLKTLHLDHNENPLALLQIKNVAFTALINLNVSCNYISTLDLISDLFLPTLKILNISENKITSISPLRKLYCPSLTSIFLDNNQIKDGSPLVALFAKSLTTIRLEQNKNDSNFPRKYGVANINWYFKLQSTGPRILISSSSMRNKRILCKLKEKIMGAS